MKTIVCILISAIIFITSGCSYLADPSDSTKQIIFSRTLLEEEILKGASHPIVGVWVIQREDASWFHIAIIPNDNNQGFQFKGILLNTGSIFDKGAKPGESLLDISKIESNDNSYVFWGSWRDYLSPSKKDQAIKFEITANSGKIKGETASYDAFKLSLQSLSCFAPAINSQQQKTNTQSISGYSSNASGYGEISSQTGRPKTVHVNGYHRKDGTYVKPHYRSPPRKK